MRWLILALMLLPGCSSMRTVGNSETHLLEPAVCTDPGVVYRDDVCYSRVIISAKDDAHVTFTKPDGTIYEVDNTGQPSFAHDLAATVQAVALQKAMKDD